MAARSKLEEHIRDTFNKREIAPSDRAWNQLSAGLENQRPKGKRGFFWVAAAAVLIGLLVVSTVYFNMVKSPGIDEVKVVEVPVSDTKVESDTVIAVANTDRDEKADHDKWPKVEMERGIKEIDKGSVLRPYLAKKESEAVTLDSETEIPERETAVVAAQEVINRKIEEVISQVALLERADADMTDAEVDSLLLQAQRELLANSIFRDDRSVDAMALLADVEGELDRSFREQILDMLKEGYLKARTAVVARNN